MEPDNGLALISFGEEHYYLPLVLLLLEEWFDLVCLLIRYLI
jgi:hypothetical protein